MIPTPETSAPADDAQWLVFACTQCTHPLKVRADQSQGMFRCPSCQHEQAAPATGVPAAAQHPASLPSAPTLAKDAVFAGGLAVDRLGTTQFRHLNDPALAIPEQGIRVRKRKRRAPTQRPGIDTPAWEVDLGAPSDTPGEEVVAPADGWEQMTSTTVKQEVLDDGSVVEHRKRTKRKRLPPAVQKAWAAITRVGSFSLLAVGLFVLVGAAVAGWYLARSQAPVVAQVVTVDAFPQRYFPSMDEGTAAAEVVRQFLLADTVEEKLQHVRFPEKVNPLMDLWYKGRPDRSIKASRDELAETLTKFIHVDGTKFVVVTMLLEDDQEYKLFAVESSELNGLKVDWETAAGWQAMTVEEFIKGKPTTPQPFRVHAAPSDYYNGHYSDASKWCAVDLSYPGNPDFSLFGYVERNTPTGDRLMTLLGFRPTRSAEGKTEWMMVQGTSLPLILAIAYLREGSDPKQVTIHELLHEQWFLRDGPAVGHARASATNP